MARRRVYLEVITQNQTKVKVFWDSEWQEYIVRTYIEAVLVPDYDYFTEDRDDAIDTAKVILQGYRDILAARSNVDVSTIY